MSLWLWRLAAAVTFWSFGFYRLQGGDLFWHVAIGRLLLEQKVLVSQDAWSFTQAGTDWIQHEWLADTLYAVIERSFGLGALVYWKWAMVVAIHLTLFELLRRLTQDPLASYLSCVAALALAGPFLDFRPHLYSMLGYALVLFFCLGRRLPPWLPLIYVVWSNLHGGVIFGLMVLALLAMTQRGSLKVVMGCGLATLLNPAGLGALGYGFKYALNPHNPYLKLAEWRSPFAEGALPNPLYPLALTVMAAALGLIALQPEMRARFFGSIRGEGVASLTLIFLTLAMSLKSGRFTPFFALSLALLLAPCLAWVLSERAWRPPWLPPCLALAYGAWYLTLVPLGPRAFPFLVREQNFPVETVDFLEANRWRGKVFNYYGWGGYLHFRTGGRALVFCDQRADTVFPPATFQKYLDVLERRGDWIQIVEQSGAEAFLWPRDQPHPAHLTATGHWRWVYQDAVSVLLLRSGVVTSSQPGPLTGYRYFSAALEAFSQGRSEQAEEYARNAVELAPHLDRAWLLLAELQVARAEHAAARETLSRANRCFPLPILEGALARLKP